MGRDEQDRGGVTERSSDVQQNQNTPSAASSISILYANDGYVALGAHFRGGTTMKRSRGAGWARSDWADVTWVEGQRHANAGSTGDRPDGTPTNVRLAIPLGQTTQRFG